MSAKIKLQRIGTKSKPFYRIVVQDESSSVRGKVVAILGKYHPLRNPAVFELDRDKTAAWIKKGALPTEKLRILLGKAGILPPIDLAALPKRKKKGEAAPAAEPVAAASAPAEEAK